MSQMATRAKVPRAVREPQMLDQALRVFAERGYHDASMAEIAARAGVNQQLIAYYFDGKEGLYRELGRRWRSYEAEAFPEDMDFGEMIKHYVRTSATQRHGSRLLAWAGLADTGEDADEEEASERDARLQQEVEQLRERQRAGELDDRFDPAVLHLITMSAANALAVYPQLARGLFGEKAGTPELVEHYAEQLALLLNTTRRQV